MRGFVSNRKAESIPLLFVSAMSNRTGSPCAQLIHMCSHKEKEVDVTWEERMFGTGRFSQMILSTWYLLSHLNPIKMNQTLSLYRTFLSNFG